MTSLKQAYSFDDVLIVPQYSDIPSRSECDTTTHLPAMQPMGIPVFAANMDTICGLKMAHKMHELGGVGIIHRYMTPTQTLHLIREWSLNSEWETADWDDIPRLTVAVGSLAKDRVRIDSVMKLIHEGHPLNICIDIAHGDSRHVIDTLEYLRKYLPDEWGAIIAGNVCTYEGACRLFDAGAHVVKVGVGGGSACTTRIKTGCGYPQLAAISECSDAGPIIADGGIRYYGDAAKALAAGAEAVMIGGMLAGTDCTPNWSPESETTEFRGMASKRAREACSGSDSNAEGVSAQVVTQPEGSTQSVVEALTEGLRSAMAYSACRTLQEFREKSKLVYVTRATVNENRPHIED